MIETENIPMTSPLIVDSEHVSMRLSMEEVVCLAAEFEGGGRRQVRENVVEAMSLRSCFY